MTKLTGASYRKIAGVVMLAFVLFIIAGWSWFGMNVSNGFFFGGNTQRGNASIEASSVNNLSISWAAGSVEVNVVDEGSTIEVTETASGGFTKAQEMRWKVEGDTLKIDFGNWMSCFSLRSKNLEVSIPRRYAEALGVVSIDGASGQYRVQGLSCDQLKFDLASGKLEASDVVARELSVDVASGNASVAGNFVDSVSVKIASGWVSVKSEQATPRKLKADVASGDLTFMLPKNAGFTAQLDKASGSFNNGFSATQQGRDIVVGDGLAAFDFDMASGAITLDPLP